MRTPSLHIAAAGAAFLWAAAAGGSAHAQALAYTLDPDHSFVHFEVQHFGTSTTRGRFGPVRGVVLLDRAAGRGELSLRIPTASVDTGIAVFNARLRQADLLASTEHPEAFFVATRFRFCAAASSSPPPPPPLAWARWPRR
jgi:polyisoprenoid-binding protein YceI